MDFFVLECRTALCNAEFYLNDIPVTLRGPDYGTELKGPMNHLVRSGVNTLEIVVNPGPTPGQALVGAGGERRRETPPEGAFAAIKLSTYPKGAVIDGPDEQELVSLQWRARAETPEFFPRVVGVAADLGETFPPWRHEAAQPLRLDDETRQSVAAFVLAVHGYVTVNDFEMFALLSEPRCTDTDVAYGKRPGATTELVQISLENQSRQAWWGMQPLQPAAYDFRLCGKNRLVECVSAQWKPVIEEVPDPEGAISRYPMMVGRIDGEWRIFR